MHIIKRSYISPLVAAFLKLTVVICPTAAKADVAFIDPMPRWALAGAFGTPRLYLKSLLADKPRGAEQTVRNVASSLGFGQDIDYGQPTFSFGLRPLLVYDTNINSGLPFDSIDLGPFRFTVSEETRARQAWTFGARASTGIDIPLAEGLVLNAYAQVGRRHAPDYDTNITDRSIGVCLRYTADSWTYADGCLWKGDIDNERSKASSRTRSLSIGHLFEAASATHDLSLTVIQQESLGQDQNRIRLTSRSMIRDFGALDAGVTFGEKIEGSLKQTFAADLGYGVILMGRPTRLSISYAEDTGGNLFGLSRSERTWTVRASRTVAKKITAYVSHKKTTSSIPEFGSDSWGLAHPTGFEPVASAFGGQHSIQLSYGCLSVDIGQQSTGFNCLIQLGALLGAARHARYRQMPPWLGRVADLPN